MIQPRHVLCFLGLKRGLAAMKSAVRKADIDGFEVDDEFSTDQPDDRMPASFEVSRDRVVAHAWTKSDAKAIDSHGSVLYVLSPRMTQESSLAISRKALALVALVLDGGAIAAKGESAGVAHGAARWRALAREGSTESPSQLARVLRLAFVKRPIAAEEHYETIGNHLVGLPEVYVPLEAGTDREAAAIMDEIADEMIEGGVRKVRAERKAKLVLESTYEPDDFKFNPYGHLIIPRSRP